MSAGDIVVLALVALGVVVALVSLRRHGGRCGGSCCNCAWREQCSRCDKKQP